MKFYDFRIRFHISNNSIKVVVKRKQHIIRNPDKANIPLKLKKQVSD